MTPLDRQRRRRAVPEPTAAPVQPRSVPAGWRHVSPGAVWGAVWVALCVAVAVAWPGEPEPLWPPAGRAPDNSVWNYHYNGDELPTATSAALDAMDADSSLQHSDPDDVMTDHSAALRAGLDRRSMSALDFGVVSDTTTWADIEAFYTAALAGTGLTRDSTADGFVETPFVRRSPGDPLAPETPRVWSRHAAWTYVDRWGDDDLTFSVMLSVVQSGYPGRTYRFLTVKEPRQTWL